MSRTLPQICYFCGEEISERGRHRESLTMHSLDGCHENMDPTNKVPCHKGCHLKYHNGSGSVEVTNKYATILIYRDTRARIRELKEHGITVDRFLNNLMDRFLNERFPPKERKESENEKNEPQT